MKIIDIFKLLNEKFSDSIEHLDDVCFIKANPSKWEDLAVFIKDNDKLKFDYLMCISSYDSGNKETYGVAYNFKSTSIGHELEIRIEELESKFSKDLSESTFNEIREFKKLQKIN